MKPALQPPPPVGRLEIHYPDGIRSLNIYHAQNLLAAPDLAHDIWEDHEQRLSVRVVRLLPDGEEVGICHLRPEA